MRFFLYLRLPQSILFKSILRTLSLEAQYFSIVAQGFSLCRHLLLNRKPLAFVKLPFQELLCPYSNQAI